MKGKMTFDWLIWFFQAYMYDTEKQYPKFIYSFYGAFFCCFLEWSYRNRANIFYLCILFWKAVNSVILNLDLIWTSWQLLKSMIQFMIGKFSRNPCHPVAMSSQAFWPLLHCIVINVWFLRTVQAQVCVNFSKNFLVQYSNSLSVLTTLYLSNSATKIPQISISYAH